MLLEQFYARAERLARHGRNGAPTADQWVRLVTEAALLAGLQHEDSRCIFFDLRHCHGVLTVEPYDYDTDPRP